MPSRVRSRDDPALCTGEPAAAAGRVPQPVVQVTATGQRVPLRLEVTTVGRGAAVGIRLDEASVSVLHAELVRRGPYVYVADLGLSANGTLVNGRPVTRRLLASGDVLCFGAATAVITGITAEALATSELLKRPAVPELTRREADVLTALCRPALGHEAFTPPATPAEIAAALVVSEAAVKQHLLRLYAKFRIPEGGTNRRTRLANAAIATGLAALPARAATAVPGSPPQRAPGDETGPVRCPGKPTNPGATRRASQEDKMTHSADNGPGPGPGDDQAAALEKLAAELGARGYKAQLNAPGGRPPSLAVTNPQATMLTETVMADATSFWWPWADRIANVAEVATAADVIARVLAAAPGGGPA